MDLPYTEQALVVYGFLDLIGFRGLGGKGGTGGLSTMTDLCRFLQFTDKIKCSRFIHCDTFFAAKIS
jgi:hypothetical protein